MIQRIVVTPPPHDLAAMSTSIGGLPSIAVPM
jgi:hypothetical protein